jgi:uncharacterized membrane-anchored protein YitT (DUF2179 family)
MSATLMERERGKTNGKAVVLPTPKQPVIKICVSTALILVGSMCCAFGIKSFLVPNQFIDGGATGVSMLLEKLTGIPLGVLLVLVNLPFYFLGRRFIGSAFAWRTIAGIVVVALAVSVMPFPAATADHLLGAVFGGFFIGAGVGLAMRGGGVLDGTEILAVVLSKHTFVTVGEAILGLNVVVFSAAAFVLGVEPALYSMLTYFAASKTIDYLLHGIEAYNGVMVFSSRHEPIRQSVLAEMGRGVTVLKAAGGYTAVQQEVLYCVVTRLELTQLETLVRRHDPSAFIVITPVHDVSGGMVKQRTFH